MVKVDSGVVQSVSAGKVLDRITEAAAIQMVYGSQAEKAAHVKQPHPRFVALAAGALTCGSDKEWSEALKHPDLAKEQS